MRLPAWIIFAGLLLIPVVGCRVHHANPIPAEPVQVAVSDIEYEAFFDTVENVLRRHRFSIAVSDRRSGRIVTSSVGGQHFFEIWRNDVASHEDFWQATAANIRRRVTVTIGPGQDRSRLLTVVVQKERYSQPSRGINNSAAIMYFFRQGIDATRTNPPTYHWVDIGRDGIMETRIRDEILAEGGVQPILAQASP